MLVLNTTDIGKHHLMVTYHVGATLILSNHGYMRRIMLLNICIAFFFGMILELLVCFVGNTFALHAIATMVVGVGSISAISSRKHYEIRLRGEEQSLEWGTITNGRKLTWVMVPLSSIENVTFNSGGAFPPHEGAVLDSSEGYSYIELTARLADCPEVSTTMLMYSTGSEYELKVMEKLLEVCQTVLPNRPLKK